jgi:hypothetical protein
MDLIKEIRKEHRVAILARGSYDRKFAIKHGVAYLSLNSAYKRLYDLISNEKDKEENFEKVNIEIKNLLKKSNPKCVVFFNDSQWLERTIILEAKKLGIPTLNIQHGLWSSEFSIPEGKFADYMLVWGKYYANLIKTRIEKQKIREIGYIYSVENREWPREIREIYLFDQGDLWKKEIGEYRIKKMLEIYNICNDLGLTFTCRLYRKEYKKTMEKEYPGIKFETIETPIRESIKNGHVFISFNSTALVEAFVNKRITIQLLDMYPRVENYPLNTDNFEKLGICSKTIENTNELRIFMTELVKNYKKVKMNKIMNEDVVVTRGTVGERFSGLLKQLNIKG